MIEYGVMVNGQLIKHLNYHDGDKPITYAEMPSQEGYRAVYEWNERDADILQVWSLAKDDSEWEEHDPTAEELLSILTGESE